MQSSVAFLISTGLQGGAAACGGGWQACVAGQYPYARKPEKSGIKKVF